jgi:hypothetical protein
VGPVEQRELQGCTTSSHPTPPLTHCTNFLDRPHIWDKQQYISFAQNMAVVRVEITATLWLQFYIRKKTHIIKKKNVKFVFEYTHTLLLILATANICKNAL